ncbi:MAG: phosphatidylglycerophosphatase A [Granulosicoccus sp.]|nr:phosphatidylglycerophosphatase A [Granulosicoccus sp.]
MSNKSDKQSETLTLSRESLFTSPASFVALGFGLGLAPRAPGTAGTFLGIPILLVMPTHIVAYTLVLIALFGVGVWCCARSAEELGVHDHPGIVWDEVVGYLIAMAGMPRSLLFIVVGFLIFRFFDIVKPWPIGWVDNHAGGGWGIMLDDVLAGLYTVVILNVLLFVSGV